MISRRRRLRQYARRLPALFVWVAAVAAAVTLYHRQERSLPLAGVASEVRYVVAPSGTGRLERLEVGLGQDVAKGSIVASLDDRDLLLDLREARAEISRLELDVERESGLLAGDVESAVLEHLLALAEQAEDRIRLLGLELALSGTTSSVADEAGQTRLDALKTAIAAREPRIERLEARRRQAELRYEACAGAIPAGEAGGDAPLRPHRHAVEVQEIRIERVNLEIGKLVLRAPGAGRVAEIHRRPGELAPAGQPVVSIVSPLSTEIVAWIPEERVAQVHPGDRVGIRRPAAKGGGAVGTIAFLGARLEPLPARIDARPDGPDWGLPVHISLPPSLAARPGEAFEIELLMEMPR